MSQSLDNFVRDAMQEHDGVEPSAAETVVTSGAPGKVQGVLGVLPGHSVEGFIARGGMGAVYRARQKALEREVAVKVMTRLAESPEMAERFRREALVLGRLEHPNIVPIHELGTDDDGQLFYTMKLVKGRTLQAILNDLHSGDMEMLRLYPLASLLTVFRKVCDALAFAHSQGVLHRDLKPENIMVGEFGEVLVMDWGLAKVSHEADRESAQFSVLSSQSGEVRSADKSEHCALSTEHLDPFRTLDGSVMGTPQYMSPEQALGQIDELDERSDIFSLGGILYAILTLRPPVEGATLEEVLEKVRSGSITSPSDMQAGTQSKSQAAKKGDVLEAKLIKPLPHVPGGRVPPSLSSVVMQALRLDKAKRYQSVAAFSADLEKYQGGFATTAEHAGLAKQLMLLIKRHQGIFSTAAAAWLIVTALAVWFVINLRAKELRAVAEAERATRAEALATQEKKATRRALMKSSLSLADAALREGNGPAMQAALNDVPDDLRDSTWSYLLQQSDTSLGEITPGSAVLGLAPHPKLPVVFALAHSDGTITFRDVRHGALLWKFGSGSRDTKSSERTCLAISPDGERLATGSGSKGAIAIYRVKDGQKLLEWDASGSKRLEFSPDGRLLLETERDTKFITVWEAATGKLKWRFEPGARCAEGVFTPDSQFVLRHGFREHLQLVKAEDGSVVRELGGDTTPGIAIAMRPDGKLAVVALRNGKVKGIDLQDGRAVFEFRPHDVHVPHLAFLPDGLRFVTAARLLDGRLALTVRDARSGEALQSLLGGSGLFESGTAVHPISGELVSSGRAWDIIGTPEKWTSPARPDGNTAFWGSDDIVFAATDGNKGIWQNLQAAAGPSVLWTAPDPSWNMPSVSTDGRLAVIGRKNNGGAIQLFRRSGDQIEELRTIEVPGVQSFVRLSPTGDRFAIAVNPKLELWDTTTGKPSTVLDQTNTKDSHDAVWLGQGEELLSLVTTAAARGNPGSVEKIFRWDTKSGKVLQSVTHPTAMDCLAVAPDGRRFAEAGADRLVRIRDMATLAVQQEFRAHDGSITALAWHPTRPILATTSTDLSVRLWDLGTGRRLEEMRGPLLAPQSLVFSPSGHRLACAGPDAVTRIWEPPSLREKAGEKVDAEGWEDLLASLTPALVAQHGNSWRMNGGTLHGGRDYAVLPLAADLSGANYQVRVKLRQLIAKECFHLALPVADRMVGFQIDGFPTLGFYTGLQEVNGKRLKDLPGALHGKQIKDSDQHQLTLTVRLDGANAHITATLDARPLYDWTGPTTALSPGTHFVTPPATLALGAIQADWVVYEVKVKRLPKSE